MKRYLRFLLALAVSILAIGTLPAVAAPAQTSPTYHPVPLRLDVPNWQPLTGKQIAAMFTDRDVTVEEKYEPAPGIKIGMVYAGGCPPLETFASDGRWQMMMCSILLRVYNGHWSIEPKNG